MGGGGGKRRGREGGGEGGRRGEEKGRGRNEEEGREGSRVHLIIYTTLHFTGEAHNSTGMLLLGTQLAVRLDL